MNTSTETTFQNIINTVDSLRDSKKYDPFGLHSMSGYANQPTTLDLNQVLKHIQREKV